MKLRSLLLGAGVFALGFAAGLLALPAYEEWERRTAAQRGWDRGRDRDRRTTQ